jgi:hypothetical protein
MRPIPTGSLRVGFSHSRSCRRAEAAAVASANDQTRSAGSLSFRDRGPLAGARTRLRVRLDRYDYVLGGDFFSPSVGADSRSSQAR